MKTIAGIIKYHNLRYQNDGKGVVEIELESDGTYYRVSCYVDVDDLFWLLASGMVIEVTGETNIVEWESPNPVNSWDVADKISLVASRIEIIDDSHAEPKAPPEPMINYPGYLSVRIPVHKN